MMPQYSSPMDRPDGEKQARSRPVCPVCDGRLVEIRAKLVCSQCHTICETCCDGGCQ